MIIKTDAGLTDQTERNADTHSVCVRSEEEEKKGDNNVVCG